MAFRADEAAAAGYERAKSYLIGRNVALKDRSRCELSLMDVIDKCGPVVEGYPVWHPLVSKNETRYPATRPSERCGYKGLDHTILFAHGFISCPYGNGDDIFHSVEKLYHPCAAITAERLDTPFYNKGTTAILVRCVWEDGLWLNQYVPKKIAVPLMLEFELPAWHLSELAERWETMRPYFLGKPHGSRSSLFIDQDTAILMKKIHNLMNESGMFGPLQMG